MGLDMYLDGEKFFFSDYENPHNDPTEDGYRLTGKILRLGYWRKHPNLHGYIIQKFADGKDECQRIYLTADNIGQILDAVQRNALPYTEGFFFGVSDGTEKPEDIRIFTAALHWLLEKDENPRVDRSICYRASW